MLFKKVLITLISVSVLSTSASANPGLRKGWLSFLKRLGQRPVSQTVEKGIERGVGQQLLRRAGQRQGRRIAYLSMVTAPSGVLISSLWRMDVPKGQTGLFLAPLPFKPWSVLSRYSVNVRANALRFAALRFPDLPANYIAATEGFLEVPHLSSRIILDAWSRAETGAETALQAEKNFLEDLMTGSGSIQVAQLPPRDEDLLNAYVLSQARAYLRFHGFSFGIFKNPNVGKTPVYFFNNAPEELNKFLFLSPDEQQSFIRPVNEIVKTANAFEKDLRAVLEALRQRGWCTGGANLNLSEVSRAFASNYALSLVERKNLPPSVAQLILQSLSEQSLDKAAGWSLYKILAPKHVFPKETDFAYKRLIALRTAHYADYLFSSAYLLLPPMDRSGDEAFEAVVFLQEQASSRALIQAQQLVSDYIPPSLFDGPFVQASQALQRQQQKNKEKLDNLRKP